jgi:hypothetical protein
MYKVNVNRILKQIRINTKNQYIEWEPDKLLDNIFEILAIITQSLNVKLINDFDKVKDNPLTYRVYYSNKDAITVAENL